MKSLHSLPAMLAASLIFANFANAQSTIKPGGTTDEATVLSPFIVNTSKDVGFVAASSLAGGRLAADLKDTPVAYSVLTREFIDALGIEDLNKAVEWTVGMHKNYDTGADMIFAQNESFSARGITGVSTQRNFFPLNTNFDSYNLDRYDFARGPNSVLFGAGGIGAAANSVTKKAVFGRSIREIEVRTGSWANNRITTDLGGFRGPVALRLNTLWQDKRGWRDGDYEKKKAAFLTGTVKIGARTEFRFEGEYGKDEGRLPYTNINDQITGWTGATYNTIQAGNLGGNAAARNRLGISQYGTDSYVYSSAFGTDQFINFQNTPQTIGAGAAGTFIGGVPVVGSTAIGTAGRPILFQQNLPANRFDFAAANSQFRLPDRKFAAYFDNQPMFTQRYRDFAVYLNHHVGTSFFFEAAADYNKTRRWGDTTYNRGFSDVRIDINQVLPTGASNPNFLKPYFESTSQYSNFRDVKSFNARLAAAYVADTRLGKYIFNVLVGTNRQHLGGDAWQLSLPLDADSRLWPTRHLLRYRQYWGQADKGMPRFPGSVSVVDPVTGTTRSVTPVWTVDTGRADNVFRNTNNYNYGNLAAQAKLFDGRLNLIGAYRVDQYNNSGTRTLLAGDYPAGWDGHTPSFRPAAPVDFYTLPPVVARDASGAPIGGTIAPDQRPRDANGFALTQYMKDRFRDDYASPDLKDRVGTFTLGGVYNLTKWLGLAANYAETFSPPGVVQRYDNSQLPATASKGIDGGLRLNLLGGKISASVNYFKSHQDGAAIAPPANSATNFTTIYQTNAIGDTSAAGRNIRGFADLPLIIRDTNRINTSGIEVEVTANLTSQWRLSANYSVAKPLQDKAYPDTIAYYAAHEKDFIQILADAGVSVDPTTKVATVNAVSSVDAPAAASAWNGIQTGFIANLTDRPRIIPSTYRFTANLFTDYTLRGGRLDGLRMGGGVNYRAKQVLGFRGGDTIVNPADPTTAIDDPSVDAFTPVSAAPTITGTGTLGYTWKFANRRSLAVTLRIDNLFNDTKPRYFVHSNNGTGGIVMRPPNGDVNSPARISSPREYFYIAPRSMMLSARLNF